MSLPEMTPSPVRIPITAARTNTHLLAILNVLFNVWCDDT